MEEETINKNVKKDGTINENIKFEKYMNDTALADWLKFIINPKVIDTNNEEIKKAKKVLEEISQDENERNLAELREKYIMNQKAAEAAGFDKGLECGIEQGLEHGIEQGIKQGKKNKAMEIAKKMREQGIEPEKIIEITNLSADEILKL